MSHLLNNIRVLDLSRVLAGPWTSQTLADLGAEVIKIERPGQGDDTRSWGPPYFKSKDGVEFAAYYLATNRGKKSVCIDLADEEGVALVKQLAAQSDIVIENFKFGDMARRGLDYESLRKDNPRLIYCSITGFGQTGPYKHRPGYDFLIQGMGGLMSITGEPESGPTKVGVALTDILTGLYSTIAILAALQERQESGEGQSIDMSLMDVLAACLANQASNYLVSGKVPGLLGNAHPNVVPYQTFPTSDGHLIVAVGNDKQFRSLCGALGAPQLADDARFTTNALRVEYRNELAGLISERTRKKNLDEWLIIMEAAGVPSGPINTIDRVFADAQVKARGTAFDINGFPQVANPMKFSRSELNYAIAPPDLGQDTLAVLRDKLQLSEEQISGLLAAGVLSDPSV